MHQKTPAPIGKRRERSAASVSSSENLGRALRAARLQAGLTLEQVAGTLLLSRSHLANVEAGRKSLGDRALAAATELYRLGPHFSGGQDHFSITRSTLAQCYDYEVDQLVETLTVDPEGNASIWRSIKGLRPTRDDEPLREVLFRTSIVGAEPGDPRAWLTIAGRPAHCDTTVSSRKADDGILHTVAFSSGWRRSDGGSMSIDFRDFLAHAFTLSSAKALTRAGKPAEPAEQIGRFTHSLPHLIRRMEIEVVFPAGYKTARTLLEGHFGPRLFRRRSVLDGVLCRHSEISHQANQIRAVILEPLPTAVFSIVWSSDKRWMTT